MKPLYFILFYFVFFSSCKKEKGTDPAGPYVPIKIPCRLTNNIDTLKGLIVGTWEWREETRTPIGHPDPIYLTPQTEGYTLLIIFSIDGSVKYYKNNKLFSDDKYKIQPLSDITGFPEDRTLVLAYYKTSNNLFEDFVPITGCNDYLILNYAIVSDFAGKCIFLKNNQNEKNH